MQKLIWMLPIATAVLVETHIRFLMFKSDSPIAYLGIALQLLLEATPMFAAQYWLVSNNNKNTVASHAPKVVWLITFLIYPLFLINLIDDPSSEFHFLSSILFSYQLMILLLIAGIISYLSHAAGYRNKYKPKKFLSRLFELNVIVVAGIVGWAMLMAGIFNTTENPMLNLPINPLVDVKMIFSEFSRFLGYVMQFILLGSLVGFIYFINRYWFIRLVLSQYGVMSFIMVSTICIIVMTPLLSFIGLQIPLNTPQDTLIPSANNNIFDMTNYHFMFLLLAISTPIILAFERKQQQVEVSHMKSIQTFTELKLLQQQINPHFLFNTLNNLYALTLIKSEEAPDMVMRLSNLLRYTVYEGQKDTVSLAQEISYLKDFIALHKIRIGEQYQLDIKWPEQQNNYKLPPLLLINIIENTFKYAIQSAKSDSPKTIKIHLTLSENRLTLICENPCPEITSQTASTHTANAGVGLANLKRRLALIYPQAHELSTYELQGETGHVWQTKLTINTLESVT